MKSVTIHQGDSLAVLKKMPDNSIDSIVTDPPYVLTSILKRFGGAKAKAAKSTGRSGVYARQAGGFMGKGWDVGKLVHRPAYWRQALRVLKPGGYIIAFSGTRTQHRQTCAIEDAGFEIRDTILDIVAGDTFVARFVASLSDEQVRAFALAIEESSFGGMLAWTFGSGFPKSHDLAKQYETSICERVQLNGRAIWVYVEDGATMATEVPFRHPMANLWSGWGTALKPAFEPICVARKPLISTVAANVLAHGVGALNIDACRVGTEERDNPGASVTSVHRKSRVEAGHRHDAGVGPGSDPSSVIGRWPANIVHDGSDEVVASFPLAPGQLAPVGPQHGAKASVNVYGDYGARSDFNPRGDAGSAARFFYSAKADADDRLGSKHPTVKPIDLMRYLVRLVTPPGGVVLDPFAGTGSTGVAAMLEGFDSILIERDAESVADIERKVAFYRGEGRLAVQEKGKVKNEDASALPLFADRTGEAA